MTTTNTREPTRITKGETLEWTKSLADYPASDWTLTYYFRGPGAGFDVTATADGDDYAITVPATDTSGMTPGMYEWQARVVAGAEKFEVASGAARVVAGFIGTTAATAIDSRSDAKKILDAIDAQALGKATLDQQEYTIGNRQLKRIPITELKELRKLYAQIYASELRRERGRKGGSVIKSINSVFRNPR